MGRFHLFAPRALLLLACASTVGCQGVPPGIQAVPETVVGQPAVPMGSGGPPDASSKEMALAGVAVAGFLGPALQEARALLGAYYDAELHHGAYQVLDVSGWRFSNGWYYATDNTGDRTLRAQFDDASNTPPNWDVTRDANYGPGSHSGFPSGLVGFRLDGDLALASGGDASMSFQGPLPDTRSQVFMAEGTGGATVAAPLNQMIFQALNASFSADGPLNKGDLVLRSLTGGQTTQFSGQYDAHGLAGSASVLLNAQAVGQVSLVGGSTQYTSGGNTYPLQ